MIYQPCPHCPPEWPHEHIGDTSLPVLIRTRDDRAHIEYCFHGTMEQCNAFTGLPDATGEGQLQFEALLIRHKDWDKALAEYATECAKHSAAVAELQGFKGDLQDSVRSDTYFEIPAERSAKLLALLNKVRL